MKWCKRVKEMIWNGRIYDVMKMNRPKLNAYKGKCLYFAVIFGLIYSSGEPSTAITSRNTASKSRIRMHEWDGMGKEQNASKIENRLGSHTSMCRHINVLVE